MKFTKITLKNLTKKIIKKNIIKINHNKKDEEIEPERLDYM
jgi:hypothetical protein